MVANALEGKALPVYGDSSNIRDWVHVSDRTNAIKAVIQRGTPGGT